MYPYQHAPIGNPYFLPYNTWVFMDKISPRISRLDTININIMVISGTFTGPPHTVLVPWILTLKKACILLIAVIKSCAQDVGTATFQADFLFERGGKAGDGKNPWEIKGVGNGEKIGDIC